MSDDGGLPRIGRFFLKPRGKAGIYYLCHYDPATRQTVGVSSGTADLKAAELALAEHALTAERPQNLPDAPLADVLMRYWLTRGQHLPSADVFRVAMGNALEIWGNPDVSTLTAGPQRAMVAKLRAAGLADSTILRRLAALWAAINLAHEEGILRAVPPKIGNAQWSPVLRNSDRVVTLDELAALFNAAAPNAHCWRFMILAIGTAARPTAILELTRAQVDLDLGVLDLLPDGRRQTKKRRPLIPMAPTLAAWVKDWGPGHLITYRGRPMTSDTFFDNLTAAAGVDCTRKDLRHTVRTWFARQGVDEWEADQFMGHRGRGSHTGARYAHFRPEYMRQTADAIERLYEALAPMVKRDLLRRDLENQPLPIDILRGTRVALLEELGVHTGANALIVNEDLERETRLELATSTLARPRPTNENNDLT